MDHITTVFCVNTRVRLRNVGRWRETVALVLQASPVLWTQWIKVFCFFFLFGTLVLCQLRGAAFHSSGMFCPRSRLELAAYLLSLIAGSNCIWFRRDKQVCRIGEEIVIECTACDGPILMSVRVQRTRLAGSITVCGIGHCDTEAHCR